MRIVAIVGRPNVGKSTLYNRLIGEREAIIDNISGVTRDRLYGTSDWNGISFTVIDTGGFVQHSEDVFETAIREQVRIAIGEANAILFMVDVTTGITDLDEDLSFILRKSKTPVFLVVNKVDNPQRMIDANEFWKLGFENTFFISSLAGSGTGDLLDAVVKQFPKEEQKEPASFPKIAILGQPNVGKSSMVNSLLGEERNIVTEVPGTTRDAIHSLYNRFGMSFYLVDTAGIRRKSKVSENLEFYSVIRAIKAMEESDVCLLMIDAQTGMESQDMKIFDLIVKRKKGIVILVNKWDLIDKDSNSTKEYTKRIIKKIAPFTDVPVIFISALTKQRILKSIETAIKVYQNKSQRIKTSQLNKLLPKWLEKHPPPTSKGRVIKIKYMTQIPAVYPIFALYCNHPGYVKPSYKNYLENQIRKNFDFSGIPISLSFREK
jgi:GTP-binding protein